MVSKFNLSTNFCYVNYVPGIFLGPRVTSVEQKPNNMKIPALMKIICTGETEIDKIYDTLYTNNHFKEK